MIYSTERSKPVTEENILKRTTEYDIFKRYIGHMFTVNSKFSSPLRKDNNPSFGVFVSKKTNNLLFKDQATGISGNCFKFVQLYENLKTYRDALNLINKDLNLGFLDKSEKGVQVKSYKASRTSMQIKRRYFVKNDTDYWDQFSIDKDTLKYFKVHPISHVWVNDKIVWTVQDTISPMYAYQIFNKFKIYRPLEKEPTKWLSNCTTYDVQGYEQLPPTGDLLIITKSLKDIMVLHKLGYTAIAANSENTLVPEKVVKELSNRFKKIIVLYDTDLPGIHGAKAMRDMYKLQCILIPRKYKIKDISDFIKEHAITETKKMLKELLWKIGIKR